MALDKHPSNYDLGELGNLVEELEGEREDILKSHARLATVEEDLKVVKSEIFKRIGTTPPEPPSQQSEAAPEGESYFTPESPDPLPESAFESASTPPVEVTHSNGLAPETD